MSPREKRFDRNQEMFRTVNERIAELETQWGGDRHLHVFCECKRVGCGEQLVVSLEQYARVRERSGWLIVKRGHADSAVEAIVEQHSAYDIVEANGVTP